MCAVPVAYLKRCRDKVHPGIRAAGNDSVLSCISPLLACTRTTHCFLLLFLSGPLSFHSVFTGFIIIMPFDESTHPRDFLLSYFPAGRSPLCASWPAVISFDGYSPVLHSTHSSALYTDLFHRNRFPSCTSRPGAHRSINNPFLMLFRYFQRL